MMALASILFAIAAIAWTVAVVSGIMMVARRKPEVGLGRLIFSGVAWFRAENFTPEAAPYRRAFIAAFAAFMALVIATAASGLFITR